MGGHIQIFYLCNHGRLQKEIIDVAIQLIIVPPGPDLYLQADDKAGNYCCWYFASSVYYESSGIKLVFVWRKVMA